MADIDITRLTPAELAARDLALPADAAIAAVVASAAAELDSDPGDAPDLPDPEALTRALAAGAKRAVGPEAVLTLAEAEGMGVLPSLSPEGAYVFPPTPPLTFPIQAVED